MRGSLQRSNGEYTLVEPKTERSRRTIALPAVALAALKGHRRSQVSERLAAGPKREDWGLVVCRPTGTALHGPAVTRKFQAMLQREAASRMDTILSTDGILLGKCSTV